MGKHVLAALAVVLMLAADPVSPAPHAEGAWIALAPMAGVWDVIGCAASSADGLIYAFGTVRYSRPFGVEVYDPVRNEWMWIGEWQGFAGGCAAVEVEGKIYIIGGYDFEGPTGRDQIYDPQMNSWATASPMPTPRGELAAVEVGGVIYAIGGYDRLSGTLAAVEA